MTKKIKVSLLAAILYLSGSQLFAQTENPKRGVFWGEIPKEEQQEEVEKFPKPVIPPAAEMMKMHPQEIDQLRQEALEYAVYTQDEKDVESYWRIIDVVRRKSAGFTGVSGYVKTKNPDLNGNIGFPTNNPGRNTKIKDELEAISEELTKINDDYALLMFTQEGCSACTVQRQILNNFHKDTGWTIKEVDINREPIAQAKFNIEGTPITVLIARENADDWLPVAIGVDSLSNLRSNIVRATRIMKGTSTPEQWYMSESQRGQYFDPTALNAKDGELK